MQILNYWNIWELKFFFSPLIDKYIPTIDALWLPGGYPELHAHKLSINKSMHESIKTFFLKNKPILAECGGMLYLLESISDLNNKFYIMAGILPGHSELTNVLVCQGMQSLILPEGIIRGHSHHNSYSFATIKPIGYGIRSSYYTFIGEAIYRIGRITASYLHMFFPSNPIVCASIFYPD